MRGRTEADILLDRLICQCIDANKAGVPSEAGAVLTGAVLQAVKARGPRNARPWSLFSKHRCHEVVQIHA